MNQEQIHISRKLLSRCLPTVICSLDVTSPASALAVIIDAVNATNRRTSTASDCDFIVVLSLAIGVKCTLSQFGEWLTEL